jgi:hypothetical protein
MGYTPIDLHLKNANRSNCEPEMSCHLRMISLLFPLPTIIIPVRENSEVAIIYPDMVKIDIVLKSHSVFMVMEMGYTHKK